MHPERGEQLEPRQDASLDALWVQTVTADDLHPRVRTSDPTFAPFVVDPDAFERPTRPERPVHGTLTVDVHDAQDRQLLERLLNGKRVLSVTAADGWHQRVRLTSLHKVDTEVQPDGSHLVVATYTWVAAASCN